MESHFLSSYANDYIFTTGFQPSFCLPQQPTAQLMRYVCRLGSKQVNNLAVLLVLERETKAR